MIVTDTNPLAYLLLGGEHGSEARAVFHRDPDWAAPLLWRSELRSQLMIFIAGEGGSLSRRGK